MSEHDDTSNETEADARAGFGQSTRRTFLSRMGPASLLATTGPLLQRWLNLPKKCNKDFPTNRRTPSR
jgi:hypothetical protein